MSGGIRSATYALGALLVGSALFVALYALTSESQRPDLVNLFRPLVIAAVAGVPGLIAAVVGIQTRQETRAQTEEIAVVKQQTNGDLRQAVAEIVNSSLDARGLVPQQRTGDKRPPRGARRSEAGGSS